MRTSLRFAAVGAALAAASLGTTAHAAATANATASAEILSSLTVTNTAGLDFGQVAVNGAGTATVGANGTNSCTANLVCTGTRQAATFDVTGTTGVGVAVTTPASAVALTYVGWTGGGAAPTMSLNNFSVDFPGGTTLVGGVTSFAVGGDLAVSATQASGVYSGSFTVSVEYQ